jgi:hypothetical protein
MFLSPEWVHQVVAAVEEAKARDPYLRGLVGEFTFKVAYVIEDAPRCVRSLYGNGSKVVVCVSLRNGVVEDFKAGSRAPSHPVDLIVTLPYGIAEKLFRGEIGVASTILGGGVRVKPVNGFAAWTKMAAKSLVSASQVLKTARTVPTTFSLES